MKKLIVFILAATTLQAWADDYAYQYLVLTDVQGNQTAMSTDGLKMTIDNVTLTITNNEGAAKTFYLVSLASMQFSETADNTTTAIETLPTNSDKQGNLEVYNLSGIQIATFDNVSLSQDRVSSLLKNTLGKGVYIVKQNGTTKKVTVR